MSYDVRDPFVGVRGYFDSAGPEAEATDVPPGWSRNPSAWPRRATFALLAAVGFFTTLYLALAQLGVVPRVFEPFFGDGTRRALDTWLGRLLPGSEAAFASALFLVETVLVLVGPRDRWRERPGTVVALGVVAGPIALFAVAAAIVQTAMFDAWCTLCLVAAAIATALAGPALEEALAALQHLRRRREPRGRTRVGAALSEAGA